MSILVLHNGQSEVFALKEKVPEIVLSDSYREGYSLIIRWGNTDGPDLERGVLNRKDALKELSTRSRVSEKLTINNLSPLALAGDIVILGGKRYGVFNKRYEITMCNYRLLRVVEVKEDKEKILKINDPYFGSSYQSVDPAPYSERVLRRACITARKALHALNLDFAQVRIEMDKRGRPYVSSINPTPALDKALVEAFSQEIREWAREEGRKRILISTNQGSETKISLGADPEFMLRNRITSEMVVASKFFPRQGHVGCDQRSVAGQKRLYPLAELRPDPKSNYRELFKEIESNMKQAVQMAPYNNVQFLGGSMPFPGYPVGGHIHFGGVKPSRAILKALDNYLALPLLLIENPESARRRRKKYGALGDFRVQAYGGFEYRTPASWLVSPKITKAVLALANLIIVNHTHLTKDFLASDSLTEDFYACKKVNVYRRINSIKDDLMNLPNYSYYEKDIDYIWQMIKAKKRWKEKVDFRKTWSLTIPSKIY